MNGIKEEMIRQHPIPGGWVCPQCIHYKGKLICEKGIFIAFSGANMSGCCYYNSGKKCHHCGMMT